MKNIFYISVHLAKLFHIEEKVYSREILEPIKNEHNKVFITKTRQ